MIRGDRVDSIGTCTFCGYHGPGPQHHCSAVRETPEPSPTKPPKPTHYKVVCISLYTADVERLARVTALLKERGHRHANRSEAIRVALEQLEARLVGGR